MIFAAIIIIASLIAYIIYTLFQNRNVQYLVPYSFEEFAKHSWIKYAEQHTNTEEKTNLLDTQKTQTEIGTTKPVNKEDITIRIKEIEKEYIEPYINIIKEQKVEETINKLFTILKDNQNCPSVGTFPYDSEITEMTEIAKYFFDISLIDHTLSVTTIFLEQLKALYSDDQLIPLGLTVGLAHDIGKIKDKDEDHSMVSAQMLSEILPDEITWKKTAIEIVQKHHEKTTDQLISTFKKAEIQSRNFEYAKINGSLTVMPFSSWFDSSTFVTEYIIPLVNMEIEDKLVFSWEDIIYAHSKVFVSCLKDMALNTKVFDIQLYLKSEEDNIIREAVQTLKNAGFIHKSLPGAKVTVPFDVTFDDGQKRRYYLIPLQFDITEEIEQRKSKLTKTISEIRPAR